MFLFLLLACGCNQHPPSQAAMKTQATNSTQPSDFEQIHEKPEKRDADSQYELAVRYTKGDGVAKDAVEAAKWFRKAAEQGSAKAQFRLAYAYDNGEGVPKDAAEAVKWYRKMAEQGFGP